MKGKWTLTMRIPRCCQGMHGVGSWHDYSGLRDLSPCGTTPDHTRDNTELMNTSGCYWRFRIWHSVSCGLMFAQKP